jgi:hypothetical protein
MALSLTSPVTGSAQTGLTSPTYTLVAGSAPDLNGRQYSVSVLGGTQTGVDVNTASKPFTLTFWWPKIVRVLQYITGSGRSIQVPMNVYKLVTRKGVICHADLPPVVAIVTTTVEAPAGSDTLDAANLRAMMSAHIGGLTQSSSGFGDTVVSATP